MVDYEKIEKSFLAETKNHEILIENDSEVHRSILFKNPNNDHYHFRINTWPGHLCISGDMGTYVFKRTYDMFRFFDMDDYDFNKKKEGLSINPSYWHEKLEGEDARCRSYEFSSKSLEATLRQEFENFCLENSDHGYTEADKEECLEALEALWDCSDLISLYEKIIQGEWVQFGEPAIQRAFNTYLETDFHENAWKDYTVHYIWCLYAIVW